MKKKYFILIGLGLFFILLFFHFFSIIRISTKPDSSRLVLVQKFNNPNRTINFLLPKPCSNISLGDLIIHKDVRYLDKPFRKRMNICNRIVGLPGNTVEIRNKDVFNNNEKIITPESELYFKYRVSFDDKYDCSDVLAGYDISITESIGGGIACEIIANPKVAEEILKLDKVISVRQDVHPRNSNFNGYFPNHMFFAWNKDFFGPVYVPQKGVTAMLQPRNVPLYDRIINVYENHRLIYNLQTITINDVEVDQYSVQKNYYFVISDNRDIGNDSRNWGFLPESYIIGKVIF